MADLKSAWPYIRFMTLAEKAAYVSDLPSDMDSFEVQPLAVSPLFSLTLRDKDFVKQVLTAEERALERSMERNGALWISLYVVSLGLGLHGMSKWYYNDGVRTFMQFRNERWPAYLKRRVWPGLAVAWTVGHWVSNSSFSTSYPRLLG